MRAYQWQAIQSNQTRNNVVWFIEDAEELAAKLDSTPEQDRGPMHGIPISVKECYFVKNCDATGGMCQYAHQPVTEDALAVELMKSFGAIPYVLTNVPQSMFSMQCSNPLYGVTGNASLLLSLGLQHVPPADVNLGHLSSAMGSPQRRRRIGAQGVSLRCTPCLPLSAGPLVVGSSQRCAALQLRASSYPTR